MIKLPIPSDIPHTLATISDYAAFVYLAGIQDNPIIRAEDGTLKFGPFTAYVATTTEGRCRKFGKSWVIKEEDYRKYQDCLFLGCVVGKDVVRLYVGRRVGKMRLGFIKNRDYRRLKIEQ